MKRLSLVLISIFLASCTTNGKARDTKGKLSESRHISEFYRREVKCVIKDGDGDIIAIEGDWGRVSSDEAIEDIKNQSYEYYVKSEVKVHVVLMKSGKEYLRTNRNDLDIDNLDNLPFCN